MISVQVFLLGSPQVERDGQIISFGRRMVLALLSYLAVTGQPHRRETLATLFWPENDPSSARANLRRALFGLRRDIGEENLLVDRMQVEINPEADIWVDTADFHSKVTAVREHHQDREQLCESCVGSLTEAVALYRGDFMAGFSLPDSPDFDEWQFFEREGLRQLLAEALQALMHWHTGKGEFEQAIEYSRQWLALDPLHEPVHRHLMRLYAWSGQQAAALRQYEECVRLLDEELGVNPEEETSTLYESIRSRKLAPPAHLASSEPGLPLPAAKTSLDPAIPEYLAGIEEGGTEVSGPHFVGREKELGLLGKYVEQASNGQGQVIFVVGDAGRGKTVLVQEFTRQAQERFPELVVASGNCNAYTGIGDPYLPFREILELLTGDVEARWSAGAIDGRHALRLWRFMPQSTQALLVNGPDLIDVFLSGPSLLARLDQALPHHRQLLANLGSLVEHHAVHAGQSAQQADLFEQYTRVLQKLAQQQPLMLVLDDLQWADGGSINLLFHLGRRLAGSHILVVGIYRPDEVAAGRDGQRHPLEPVVNEFQRHYGDILIDLRQAEGRSFVDAYLDVEPNCFDEAFRQAFYLHTKGHALFTAEMLQGLKDRGDLELDNRGCWRPGSTLNWDILPARVEGVIGERIGRLPTNLKEILKIASVEGESFTAEVAARVLNIDEREAVSHLSGTLDRQHRLVRGQGSQLLGRQRLSHYRFGHILFQRYLYNSLDEAERFYLHEAVGRELEGLYGEENDRVAGELARHFEEAGLALKAAGYYYQTGSRAVRLSANEEAIGHFERGLALLETIPETAERNRQELALQIALFAPLAGAKGYGAPEVGQAYRRARELCEKVDDPDQLFLVLYGLWGHNLVRSELQTSKSLAEECLALAERVGKKAFLMEAHRMTDESAFYLGEFGRARHHFEESFALYDPDKHRAHAEIYGQDPGVALLSHGCCILWHCGYPDLALQRSREAIELAEAQEHPFSLAFALCYSAMMHQYRREAPAVIDLTARAIELSKEQEFVFWLAQASFLRGWALAEQGETTEGISQMRQSLADWQATGTEFLVAYTTGLLAEAHMAKGQLEEGLALLEKAFIEVKEKSQGLYEAELYRLKGELLWRQGTQPEEVEGHFLTALEVAQRRQTLSQELRAAISLGRLWQEGQTYSEARQILSEVYGRFQQGFETADLQEAKALLEELES